MKTTAAWYDVMGTQCSIQHTEEWKGGGWLFAPVGKMDAACAAAPSAGPYRLTSSAVSVTMRLMVKPGMATEAVSCQMSASDPAMTDSSPACVLARPLFFRERSHAAAAAAALTGQLLRCDFARSRAVLSWVHV